MGMEGTVEMILPLGCDSIMLWCEEVNPALGLSIIVGFSILNVVLILITYIPKNMVSKQRQSHHLI